MVAEKIDPTIGQICFCRIFQTVMNLEKRITEMSSEGSKMVERSYGVAGIGLKWPKNQENTGVPTVAAVAASPARSRRVRHRLAVKFYGRLRLDVLIPHVRRMYSESGRNRLLWLKLKL